MPSGISLLYRKIGKWASPTCHGSLPVSHQGALRFFRSPCYHVTNQRQNPALEHALRGAAGSGCGVAAVYARIAQLPGVWENRWSGLHIAAQVRRPLKMRSLHQETDNPTFAGAAGLSAALRPRSCPQAERTVYIAAADSGRLEIP